MRTRGEHSHYCCSMGVAVLTTKCRDKAQNEQSQRTDSPTSEELDEKDLDKWVRLYMKSSLTN